MKIFITGATGFIGSHLVKRLQQTDHELYCLVRRSSDVRELEKLKVKLMWGDLREIDTLRSGMSGCDWVIHLAGINSFWTPHRKDYTDVNVQGTRNIMECALETGISKVIYVSTLSVFGNPLRRPIKEDAIVGPMRFSDYARSKYEADLIAWGLYNKKNLPLVILYPGIVLGSGNNNSAGQIIKRFIQGRLHVKAFIDSVHTYIHIQDVVEAIIRSAEKDDNIGQSYILGKHHISINDLLYMLSSISGIPVPKTTLPGPLVMLNAMILTILADIIKRPPLWGLSYDFMRTIKESMVADGSKAERELGIIYSPIRQALMEALISTHSAEDVFEKRRSKRLKVDMNAVFHTQGEDHEKSAHINDISVGGMFLETKTPSEKGCYISANIFGKNQSQYIYVQGRVLRKTASGMAIEITHTDEDISKLFSA